MSAVSGKRVGLAAALRGMMLMRLMELRGKGAAMRIGASFVAAFVLLWLAVDAGDAERFWWAALSMFALKFLPVYCLTKGGETLRSELKDGTMEYLWTRSVGKRALYLAFFASALGNVAPVVVAALLALTLGALTLGVEAGMVEIGLLWLMVGLATLAFAALGGALGAYSSKFVVSGLFYFAFVELGLGQLPTGLRNLAVSAHVDDVLTAASEGRLSAAFSALAGASVAILAIGGLGLVLGTLLFSTKHYVVGGEKEG